MNEGDRATTQRRVTIVLGVALGVALLVIAFLLGRMSAPASVAPPAGAAISTPVATPVVVAESPLETPSAASAEMVTATPLPMFEVPPPQLPGSVVSAPTGASSSAREAVRAYFREIEKYDDMGASNPQDFANSLMTSVTSGDYSGFDTLLAKARQQRDHLRGLRPPPSCEEHHRLSLSLAEDSAKMLERLRTSLQGGDPAGLMSMMGEAREMESRLNVLKTLTATIKAGAAIN